MPKIVEINLSQDISNKLIEKIQEIPGIISLRAQQGDSIHPYSSLISITIITRYAPQLMHLLDREGILKNPFSTITISEPTGTISKPFNREIINDSSEVTWEEMDNIIGRESNMGANGLLLMASAGALVTIGIVTNALYLVIAAMVIGPGFEPLVRIGLGIVNRTSSLVTGIIHTFTGYGSLMAAGAVMTLILQGIGLSPLKGAAQSPFPGVSLSYWTTINAQALIITAIGGLAGPILIASNRSILASGVLITLALVPSAAIAGMALVAGDFGLAGQSLLVWLINVAIVSFVSTLVFIWKRIQIHSRRMRK
jgi:hypothetical protein